jgi:hypothetical protein
VTPDRIAVATITWARTADEARLLDRALARLAGVGWPVAVANRQTPVRLDDRLRQQQNLYVVEPAGPGLVAQVQAAVKRAAAFDRPYILYVEPDKEWFFGDPIRDFVRRAPDSATVGVVVAARSDESFETYPPTQRYTEGVINHLTGDAVDEPGDYSYGPFLMNALLLERVGQLSPQLGWGWRHATFVAAHRLGLRVVQIRGDYPCPDGQDTEDDDERRHRLRQLSQNLLGLID